MENNEIDFFISHSKEVKYSIAIPIAQILSKIGFNVWIDRKYICLGKFIYPQIEDAIKLSKYCIAVIDEAYLKRTWTITELEQFHKKNTCTILPIYVNLTKDIVYNKIPWLNGIAFEYLKDNTFNLKEIIYVFLTIFLYLLKCPQSLILWALRAFCICGKPHISRSIFLYFLYQTWLKSW